MLFLYRPRQTWMPYWRPTSGSEQIAYNRQLQDRYAATQRVPPRPPSPSIPAPSMPAPSSRDAIADLERLAELHATGALSDAEFTAAKARVLATGEPS